MKVQYNVPTQNIYGETTRTGPSYLQLVTDTAQDGRRTPNYYVLSHTFVPSNNGMQVVKQEIPVEAVAFKNKIHLLEPSPENTVSHLMDVIRKQLKSRGQYDKSQEPLLQQYKNNLLNTYAGVETINTPEAVKSFINAAISNLNMLGDNTLTADVINEFVKPGTFVVDPSSGKYYLNIYPSVRNALRINAGK
jgi:hypothetical protein